MLLWPGPRATLPLGTPPSPRRVAPVGPCGPVFVTPSLSRRLRHAGRVGPRAPMSHPISGAGGAPGPPRRDLAPWRGAPGRDPRDPPPRWSRSARRPGPRAAPAMRPVLPGRKRTGAEAHGPIAPDHPRPAVSYGPTLGKARTVLPTGRPERGFNHRPAPGGARTELTTGPPDPAHRHRQRGPVWSPLPVDRPLQGPAQMLVASRPHPGPRSPPAGPPGGPAGASRVTGRSRRRPCPSRW